MAATAIPPATASSASIADPAKNNMTAETKSGRASSKDARREAVSNSLCEAGKSNDHQKSQPRNHEHIHHTQAPVQGKLLTNAFYGYGQLHIVLAPLDCAMNFRTGAHFTFRSLTLPGDISLVTVTGFVTLWNVESPVTVYCWSLTFWT